MLILTSLYLLCSIIYAIIGVTIFRNDYRNRLNRLFFIVSINMSLWAFLFTLMNNTSNVYTATNIRIYSTLTWGTFYCIMLHFFIILCSKEQILNKPLAYIILYSPAVVTIYYYMILHPKTIEEAVFTNLGWAFININRSVFYNYFFTLYCVAYMFISIGLLWHWYKETKVKREKYQANIIILSLFMVTVVGAITDILFPMFRIKSIPSIGIILMLVPSFGIWYSIYKYKLMNLNPQNVLLGVLKIIDDGVLVINRDNLIIDTNEGAKKLLGYADWQLLNHDINIIFPKEENIILEEERNSSEIQLLSKDGKHIPVLFSSSTLKDEWGDKLGSVCIFHDISQIKNYQDKLREAHDQLEKRVYERTIELKKANIELEIEINKRIEIEDEIRKLALTDNLTGLPNRALFNERLKRAINSAMNNDTTITVMFLDLDLFKMVNDTFGHSWGDELLKMVSNRLKSILEEQSTIARVGGDEFLILIEHPHDKNYVKNIAEKILESVQLPFKFYNNEIHITVSIGIAMYPIDGKDENTLIKNADIAMYKSKELGKNKYQFCDQLMKSSVFEETKLTNYLYKAIEHNELVLNYQPQVNTITGEIIGVEALIRWYHPEIGVISPNHFIPMAEKTGLIVSIGEWVIRTACKQKRKWIDMGIMDVPISINLSVKHFLNSNIVDLIDNVITETGINASDLDIEITERAFMKDSENIIKILDQLRGLGLTISIDDFGIEYSSLNYLKTFPIDKIKIAMEFIRGIGINNKDEAIIQAMIVLGKNLGVKVIAEGVETKEQVDFLKNHSCYEVQGYYYYRPMLPEGIEELGTETNFS